MELPTEVIGTSRGAVAHLLARDIQPSDQHFEWLGTGFYLWQDSPWRSRQWAGTRYGTDAAVVVARVNLDGCLDLQNPRWQTKLADADFEFAFECVTTGVPIPVNTDSGNHARDAAVINFYCDQVATDGGQVRSSDLREGKPIFEASKIRSQSHVQITIRDLTATKVWLGVCGCTGPPSAVVNIQSALSMPPAACSAAWRARQPASTARVVSSRLKQRLELSVLPRDSCSS